MTKKSNNRKFKLGETPVRYREVVLNVPMPMYQRLLKAQVTATEMGLLDPKMAPREYIMVVLANGTGMVEADLVARSRKDSLVITPEEAAAMAERVRKAKAGG